jgi:hypothetical protein
MALPTQPTAALIVTESLKRKLNGGTPSAADITRATDYGLEKVKRDIMMVNTMWRPLIKTAYSVTDEGVSRYSNPTDLEQHQSIELLDYDHSGTLTGVTNASYLYTLAADEDAATDDVEGKLLLISSGTGVNQAQQITTYVTSTKVATGIEAFTTAPISGSGYLIINEYKNLSYDPGVRRTDYSLYSEKGEPSQFYPYDDSTYGYVELRPVPDAVYGLKYTYFADLRRIDLTATLYTTLLRRWAGVFEQGVYVWTLGEDDDRYEREFQIYDSMLKQLKARDGYMMNDPSSLTRIVYD